MSTTPKLALCLLQYKAQREVMYLECGKVLGLDSLVFASDKGKLLEPCTCAHNFARIARRAGLAGVRLHDLRHRFASVMPMKGVKPEVISEALGYAPVAFAMDVYSRLIECMRSDDMLLLGEVMASGVVEVKR